VSVESSRESSVPGIDDIAQRAYELYEARGSEPGRDLDDWLQAERELMTMSSADAAERNTDAPAAMTSTDATVSVGRPSRRQRAQPDGQTFTSL